MTDPGLFRILASLGNSNVSVLLRFTRLVVEADNQDEILRLLAVAAVEQVGADGAAVLRIVDDGTGEVVASRGVTRAVAGWKGEADVIGPELGEQLRAQCGGRFQHARVMVMASGGGLYGALVLFARETPVPDGGVELAQGLVDLAALALNKAARFAQLQRTYADLRTSREAHVRTERLRALGQMAAGISHDLMNLLSPVLLHLEIVKRASAKADLKGVDEGVAELRQAVRRGVETVERLRSFSKQAPEAAPQPADLNHLAHEAVDLSRPRMASRGGRMNKIHEQFGSPPPVSVRTGEVVSALVNLIVNAIDAMPNGGTVTLRTRAARDGAEIEIEDDGPGMPKEVAERVFEPFFTTKGEAGTGLGLPMVVDCMQRHGGTIALTTKPGKGTKFTLWIPASS